MVITCIVYTAQDVRHVRARQFRVIVVTHTHRKQQDNLFKQLRGKSCDSIRG